MKNANEETVTVHEELRYTTSTLDILITYCMSGEGGGFLNPLIPVLSDLRERVERVEKDWLKKGGELNAKQKTDQA